MYHVVEEAAERPFETGPEMQLLDDAKHPDARNGPDRHAGACYGLYAPTDAVLQPVGEWNASPCSSTATTSSTTSTAGKSSPTTSAPPTGTPASPPASSPNGPASPESAAAASACKTTSTGGVP
jgi:hypothetical protein